jgi:isoamylase
MEALSPSYPRPLGPSWMGDIWNWAGFSRHAEALEICFFDPENPGREIARSRLTQRTADIWHGAFRGLKPGMLYGLRAYGPWSPADGYFFQPAKLLLDPYARAVVGDPHWRPSLEVMAPQGLPEEFNNAATAFKGVIMDPPDGSVIPEDCRAPRIPWEMTVIGELHVKGFTKLHPGVPEHLRGTYAGLAQPPVIAWLKRNGITTVQLLPVHQHLDDRFLVEKGLSNYWGYNTLAYFAPHNEYASAGDPREQVREFRDMVRALHREGIEVILDVVYNHTAEGGMGGSLLNFRGLDNLSYYRLDPANPGRYIDTTGCGNTLNLHHPAVLQMVLDSLRYWVREMEVDGFRFDLAATLGRTSSDFRALAPFFQAIRQDETLSGVKLIAEPWDIGWGGYQLGAFPQEWAELNGKFRDGIRKFWKRDSRMAPELASRLTGSREIFSHNGRGPWASVNFVTSHDGFSLADLVSYNSKHNEKNLENNRDGDSHNFSWNHGVEGPTTDETVLMMRRRQMRNFLATLFCSAGVPFLRMGDEICQSHGGNNNMYCHDTPLNWIDWSTANGEGESMAAFVSRLAALRREFSSLRRTSYFEPASDLNLEAEILWLTEEASPMTERCWSQPGRHMFAALLTGVSTGCPGAWQQKKAAPLLLLFNSSDHVVDFRLPVSHVDVWQVLVDTRYEEGVPDIPIARYPGEVYQSSPGTLAILRDSHYEVPAEISNPKSFPYFTHLP